MRYVEQRPIACDHFGYEEGRTACEIILPDDALPVNTGVIGPNGYPIMRLPEPRMIGFKGRDHA